MKSLPLPAPAAPACAPLVHQRSAEPLPGYRLLEPLGRGRHGEVWECQAPGGVRKAVKFVPLAAAPDGDLPQRLQQVKAIRHPNLLFLDRVKVVGDEVVLVTELADKSLREVLRRCRALGLPGIPRETLLGYLRDAAEALDVLNERHGLRHLNVSPENLLVLRDRVKLADAGFASVPADRDGPYAAPELRLGLQGATTDQYGLALVYRELLTGSAADDAGPIPGDDRAVLARALEADPGKRYPSCAEFVRALVGEAAPARRGQPTTLMQDGAPAPEEGAAKRPLLEPGRCTDLPGYRFLNCTARHPGAEWWVVALPDGRTRLARLVHSFGRLDPAREREAAARLTALSHPALLRFEAVRTEPDRVALVTELPGTSLRDRMEECRGQRLSGVPRPELLACLRPVAEALDELRQEHGLQHLALHPGVILFQRGRVLLLDFGLTQLFWLPAGRPPDEASARYAAPELAEGAVSPACDQYSLALIYLELLTGQNPFRRHARPRRRPDLDLVPAPDRAVLRRALHPDPRQRFPGCTALIQAMEDATVEREPEAERRVVTLPAVIAWPGAALGPALAPAGKAPPLDALLPELIARTAGGVRVQQYHGIRYLLYPDETLRHRCAAWLPPGVAQVKLTGFAQQWGAAIVHCDARSFACHVNVLGNLWQRCLGREIGLEVGVRLRQPPAPVARLTEVDVEMKPLGASKAQRGRLLWEVGPRVLESLRLHLQARPEQRQQPRLLCREHHWQVAPVCPDLALASPVECQSKDISPAGIGFFLPDQPRAAQVYLNLADRGSETALGVLARIVRVEPCGDGWYEVGATFPVDGRR